MLFLLRAATSALSRDLIGDRPNVAVDSTGMEGHTSRYFASRIGAELSSRTKMTAACYTRSHILASARASTGPSNDSPQLRPLMAQAFLAVTWDRIGRCKDRVTQMQNARDLSLRVNVIRR